MYWRLNDVWVIYKINVIKVGEIDIGEMIIIILFKSLFPMWKCHIMHIRI